MSTYNGAEYIEQQLDSIINQELPVRTDLRVFIRDDGSTDNTLDILKRYCDGGNDRHNKVDFTILKGKNVGPARSFLELIRIAPQADIYAFCDQDDVWMQGKLKTSSSALISVEENCNKKNIPTLWTSNYSLIDSDMRIIKRKTNCFEKQSFCRALFYNEIPGCTMVFNKSLLDEMKRLDIKDFRMHDILALCTALAIGRVLYDETSYTLYRQHSKNVIGENHKSMPPIKWILDKIEVVLSNKTFNYSEYAEKAIDTYGRKLDKKLIRELCLIKNYRKGFNRLRLLRRTYTYCDDIRTSLSIRIRILLGKV